MSFPKCSHQYVIIGGPSAGKTTLVEHLRTDGYEVVADAARLLLTNTWGTSPTAHRDAFQKSLLAAQLLAEEKTIQLNSPSFLDGGVFDGCAYYLCDGLPIPQIYGTISGSRYRAAFLLESVDNYVDDGVRYQNEDFTKKITAVLEDCYQKHDVEVIRLPKLPVAERLQLLMSKVKQMDHQFFVNA